jgi:NAD(P)-dependent dehydrogenase (short-subunit alcohol dehydrogenase family)
MSVRKTSNSLIVGGVVAASALTALITWQRSRRKYSFKDKVVLITGGSRGLGLVLAREFAAQGAKLAICARDLSELHRAKQELQNEGYEVFDAVCDVRNEDDVNKLIQDVHTRYGRIDVLVNNAGVIQAGPFEAQTRTDFADAMDVHFWGPFNTMKAVLPEMKKRGEGRIVNIASIGGKVAVPHLAPYCASKFALVGLSSAMHAELGKDNIHVTTVCPGLMRTGSHINAMFKGQNEWEFALFSLMNASPLSSISAETAAKQIVKATKRGDAGAIVSVQAQLAAKMNALFPELTAEVLSLVNRVLPGNGGIGKGYATGRESTSFLSPSFLTAMLDRASYRNNELRPGEKVA